MKKDSGEAAADAPQGTGPTPTAFIKVVTYTGAFTPPGWEAIAHLWLDGERLPVVFGASTAEHAEAKARAHWDAEMAKHGQTIANRAEARRKAAETRARKAALAQTESRS